MSGAVDLERFRSLFVDEAREQLAQLAALLQDRLGPTQLKELFRCAHSIKGMAATMQYEQIGQLAHALETLLDPLRHQQEPPSQLTTAALLEAVDTLSAQVEVVAEGGVATVASERAAAAEPVPSQPSLRVPMSFVDRLLESITELLIASATLERRVAEFPTAHDSALKLQALLNKLKSDVLSVRMTPFVSLVPELERSVRELNRRLGKQVRLEVLGGDVKVDRAVLDELAGPLTQLIRNAVDHGIEAPAERTAAGKPATGTLTIALRRQGEAAQLVVSDDGRGMNDGQLVEAALARGVLTVEDASRLDVDARLQLATLAGVSTARNVSEISGRGVGLDLVAARVAGLGGGLSVTSEPGRGSSFSMRVPLSLAIMRALKVVGTHLRLIVKWFSLAIGRSLRCVGRLLWSGVRSFSLTIERVLRFVGRYSWYGVKWFSLAIGRSLRFVGRLLWSGVRSFSLAIMRALKFVGKCLWSGVRALSLAIERILELVEKYLWSGTKYLFLALRQVLGFVGRYSWHGVRSFSLAIGLVLKSVGSFI